MSVRDTLMVNQNTDEEALGIKNDVDKTGKSVDNAISAAKEEILAKVKESAESGSSSGGTQTFTEDGTFTVPAGVTKILVTAFGAGGGGYNNAGGGGGERIIKKAYSVTPGTAISIKIGVGGTNGVAGGSTVIGSLVTLAGGISGKDTAPNNYKGAVGGRGGENGQDTFMAYGGKSGKGSSNSSIKGGGGGGAGYDNGGNGASYADYSSKGWDGGIGAGGGGGGYGLYPERYGEGGKGGDGIVIIEW